MAHVLLENNENVEKIAEWFLKKEIKIKGDWSKVRDFKPGGWAFQFNNEYYPDVDDTALVGMFLDRYYRNNKSWFSSYFTKCCFFSITYKFRCD